MSIRHFKETESSVVSPKTAIDMKSESKMKIREGPNILFSSKELKPVKPDIIASSKNEKLALL